MNTKEWKNEIHDIVQEEIADEVFYHDHSSEERLRRCLQNAESRLYTLIFSLLSKATKDAVEGVVKIAENKIKVIEDSVTKGNREMLDSEAGAIYGLKYVIDSIHPYSKDDITNNK